ncbi:MAG TPA: protein kinase [Polyangiaceae bacterium]|nr:protein kinase [Polyangiaceae bacterium]
MTEPNRLDEVVGGKYRIVRFLASGGMGSVYEAHHTVVRRRFAVKFLHHELALRRELLARFQREAEAAGALESEHVAAALDFGIAADGAPYIVLEYLVGESLEHLLEREGRLPIERATNVVQQACRGVQAAHAAGIVHRDLKPHNLFVCRREDATDLVKVLDFGVAKLEVVEKSAAATRTGTVLGTPSYMSPEQARGERNVGHLSDVYALGAILYELLSGKKPHPGDSHNAILHHIATQPALSLALAEPSLPHALVAVVERALAGDPARRPASVEEFALELAPWARAEIWPPPDLEPSAPRHAEPSTTLPAPEPLRTTVVPASAPESLGVASLERKSERSKVVRRSRAVFGVVAGVAVLGGVLTFVFGRPTHSTELAPSSPRATVAAGNERETVPVVLGAATTVLETAPSERRAAELRVTAAPPMGSPPASVESSGRPLGRPLSPAHPVEPARKAAVAESSTARPRFDRHNPYTDDPP